MQVTCFRGPQTLGDHRRLDRVVSGVVDKLQHRVADVAGHRREEPGVGSQERIEEGGTTNQLAAAAALAKPQAVYLAEDQLQA